MIARPAYFERLKKLKNTPEIKIITGIRRCGKSVLLEQLKTFYEKDSSNNIIYADFRKLEYEAYNEYHALYNYVESKCQEKKSNLVFIDEVQECRGFEKAINSLHSSGKYDIYITGSNAFLLSSDLATYFTGRYLEIEVFPFSLKEFSVYFNESAEGSALTDLNSTFEKYVDFGGMAGSYSYADSDERKNYLRSVYKTITERDLVRHFKISDVALVQTLSEYLMDNVGNLSSANRIANSLPARTNHETTGNYLEYLCRSFMFYKCKRYDLHGNSYLNTNAKYYLADHAFRKAIIGSRNEDWGHIYENLVYLELLRRGYEVYVGKLYQKEIDFVAKDKNGAFLYIQVSDDISREETLKRETEPLLKIKNAYPKILIARTKHSVSYSDGIKVIDLAEWLFYDI